MPLYRPPEDDYYGAGLPLRDQIARRAQGTIRGGRPPSMVDTSRPGNTTHEIVEEATKAAGVRQPAQEHTPPTRDAGKFAAGYEAIE